jgi:hypothetical protein
MMSWRGLWSKIADLNVHVALSYDFYVTSFSCTPNGQANDWIRTVRQRSATLRMT